MQSPLWPLLITFSWQELRKHPWRNAAAVVSVMLGVALAFAVHVINASALDEFAQAVRSVGGQPDLELRGRAGSAAGIDEALLARLAGLGINSAFVTLNVGAGTFQPVRVHDLSEHQMHTEAYFVPEATVDAIAATRAAGRRVVCVGTTSMRALESAARSGPLRAGKAESDLFILPGYDFQVADALITNFHLPKSTLFMLVSALMGRERMQAAYAHAIATGYRFYSYGDTSLLERAP